MGILDFEESMSEKDIKHGHRRVYNPETFRSEFIRAGFKIMRFGGYWLKLLSDSQIDREWTPEMVQASFELGERYPDIAAAIYVVAKKA